MPGKYQTIKLNENQDRRRKLTTEQYSEINYKYHMEHRSSRSLAKEYGVDKSTILMIVNPKIKARVRQRTKEHWRDYQKHGEDWAKVVKDHRHYKRDLYYAGELTGDD